MRMIRTLTLCAVMLTARLAMAHDIRADYDRSAEFYKYKTFMWVHEPQPAIPLMNDRIIKAVNAELEGRGLRLVTSNADLAVSAHTAPPENHKSDLFYAALAGGWSWYHYWVPEPSITVVEVFEDNTLVIDVIDTQTQHPVWWAAGNEIVCDKSVKHINRAVRKMFEFYPPGV
jgi:hypothetical protein